MNWQPTVMEFGHCLDRWKRRFENQSRGRLLHGKFSRDSCTQPAPEYDNAFGMNHPGSREIVMGASRILIEPLLRRPPLAPTITAIVEQEHRESEAIEKLQIFEAVDDRAGIPMAPEHNRTICLHVHIPTEQPHPIGGLKPHIFERQSTNPSPVPILPRLRMIDEVLVKDAHEKVMTLTIIS